MALRIAINGMGVIGREMLKTLCYKDFVNIVCLNDIIDVKNLEYLLKYDSIYHDSNKKLDVSSNERGIVLNGKQIALYNESDISYIPLGRDGADIVLDCTGIFTSKEKLQGFMNAGAKKVIACYACGNDMPHIVPNVNHNKLNQDDNFISLPTMEEQTVAAVLKIINDELGVQCGIVKAFRSFTNAQPTMDSYANKDFPRGRAASVNITPITDNFAKVVGRIIPELNGKVHGLAYRSPVINGSIMDFTIKTQNPTELDSLRATLKAGSNESIGYNEEALCSSDALAFDAPQIIFPRTIFTPLEDGSSLINLSVAYDNVRGFCNQMARFLKWYQSQY